MTENQVVTASRTSPRLSVGWRSVAGIAGLAGFASGGIAVFTTDNEVGSATLLAVGLYFAIVTASGRFPRIKLGEEEIDPSVIAVAAQEGAGRVASAAAEAALAKKAPEEVAMAARQAADGFRPSFWMPPTPPNPKRDPPGAGPSD